MGQQNVALFRIYVAYRTLLSVVLLIMLISPNTRQLVGGLNPNLYLVVSLLYLISNIVLMGALGTRWYQNRKFLFAIFLVDIVAIVLLTDASGGIGSGLPVLLVITVAASAVLLNQRTVSTLVAAISALAILIDTLRLIALGHLDFGAMFPAGMLGALMFGVSIMIQAVAGRLGQAEELARNRASDLYSLQRLNEQIVQHMETGILLVNQDGVVRVMNKSASGLLAPDRPVAVEQGRQLADYSEELAYQFEHWRDSGLHRAKPFNITENSPSVIANFRKLQPSHEGESLIFVEDYTPITQYAQSLKLTSLGRLTASIAHEIRNPLGAISHAAQLLKESPDLAPADERMADIMLENSGRVNQIVESVMQISRREPAKPEYLLLKPWLTDFVSGYLDSLNRDAEVTVTCDYNELLIEFDPENLQRVLGNLLDNGLRHSELATGRETAQLTVELDFSSHLCMLSVIDQGSGVPPAEREKLFEPFFTTVQGGTGMGLYLCKELCEINNSDLNYRPTATGESCFILSLNQRAQ